MLCEILVRIEYEAMRKEAISHPIKREHRDDPVILPENARVRARVRSHVYAALCQDDGLILGFLTMRYGMA